MWSLCEIRIRTLFCYILSLSTLSSGFVITTTRRWTAGETSQVCVILPADATSEETITFEMKTISYNFGIFDYDLEEVVVLIQPTNIVVPQGTKYFCQNIYLPPNEEWEAEFTIVGSLEGEAVNYTKPVAITSEIYQTFIQTDKYLYKPSQLVQFRILTVFGPFLKVSLDAYEEIWISSPSGVRLDQWLNVPNEKGLIHLSFQLSDEPEEGEYEINVQTSSGKFFNRVFKVEEYVLPRFEVKINPPNYILGTTEIITFEVCADYTFGEPVNGKASISVDNNMWDYNVVVTRKDEISGCISFSINASELNINGFDDDDDDDDDKDENDFFYYGYKVYSLTANAHVIEDGTGIFLEADPIDVKIFRTALGFKDISVQKLYKPELPYIGKVKVVFPDFTPAVDEPLIVCCEDLCKNMSTDGEGILIFGVPPHLDCNIRISAPNYPKIKSGNNTFDYDVIMYKSGINIRLKEYHSPSNSSLIIALPNEELECKTTAESIDFVLPITFATTQSSASVIVQIVSRGQMFKKTFDQIFTEGPFLSIDESLFIEPVQDSSTQNLIRGQFTVEVSLPKTVSPEAQILVWYARDDGEVVADARKVSVMECLLNSVNVEWSTDQTLPGTNATVSVTAEPLSLCSLGVVDKSVELLTPRKFLLTVKRLLQLAQRSSVGSYDYRQVDDYRYCENEQTDKPPTNYTDTTIPTDATPPTTEPTASPLSSPERRKKRAVLPSRDGSDSLRRSERSIIIGPWWPPFYNNYDDVDALYMCDEAGLYCLSNLIWETRTCEMDDNYNDYYYQNDFNFEDNFYYDEFYGVLLGGGGGGFLGPVIGPEPVPTSGPDNTETDDVNDVRAYFPETWIWDLFDISINGSYEKVLTVPDTVTEWVGSAICVHPSKGVGISDTATITIYKEFFIDLSLPSSVKRGEIFPAKITVFNYLNESLPITIILSSPDNKFDILEDSGDMTGSGMRNACVPLQDKIVLSIRIRAKDVGDVNISVEAIVEENAVSNCGSGIVQQQTDSLIKPIRVNFEGFLKEETRFKYICTNGSVSETWNIAAPGSIVPDSARGFVAVVGDLMGPTLENLGDLVKMPYGCGEQNMINFAPNIFVMQYLDSTDQNTEEIAAKAIGFMKAGYERELNYRHSDGSFSAFGERDGSNETGSTWLTAFVLNCFGQASAYISVDQNDLNLTLEWLKSQQNVNGCFESVGQLFNKAMQGGVDSGSPSLLTAYVVISMIKAGESNSTVISEALSCINATQTTTNPYSLAIKAFALALAKNLYTQAVLDKLLSLSTSSANGLYWEFPSEYESSKAVAVETASYAVLAILVFVQNSMAPTDEYSSKILPIIQWINTQRNGQGGFFSTQDTVMALQALAAFEETVSQGPVDLTVLVTMGTVSKSFSINEQNKLLQQSVALPTVPISITFDVSGEGCALLQAVLRYSVPNGEINEAFSLNVTTSTEPDVACNTKRISVCTSYLLPDEKSNMANIQINLVSGYIPNRDDLDYIIYEAPHLFKRYDVVADNEVTIYVKEITAKEICVSFRISRVKDVENSKPGTVKVFDYYKPENQASETYTLPPPSECVALEGDGEKNSTETSM